MGRATAPAGQPTYEQLQEIIRRKDNLLSGLYWDMEGLRAAAWLAHHAHDGGHPDYSEDEYAATASHLFLFLAKQTRAVLDDFQDTHRAISAAVLAGVPEGDEVSHG